MTYEGDECYVYSHGVMSWIDIMMGMFVCVLDGGAVHNAVVGIKARTCFDAALRQMFVAGARQTLSSRGYPPLLHLFITACIDVLIELINKNG